MGDTQSTLAGMQDAQNVMNAIPILGSAFQMQQAATGAGVNILGGVGKVGNGLGGILGNPVLLIGGAVVLLILIK